MRARPWFLLMVMGCALSGFLPAEAGADGGAADVFQKSYDAEATGKTQEALTSLDQLPAPQKDGYVAQLRRGYLLTKLGKNSDAVDAYTKASALEAKSVEARVGAMAPLLALKRWSDVETTAKEVLKTDASSYLANLRLAYAYYNLARFAEAAVVYRKLADMYPSDVEVRSGLGWSLLKSGKAADATKEFQAILEIAPKHALAREGLTAACAVH